MDAWDLKKWRRKHNFNQFQAAEKLGTTRSAIQDLEREIRPIWRSIELACEEISNLESRRFDYGPVTLLCVQLPIELGHETHCQLQLLRCEKFDNNESAIRATIAQELYLGPAEILIIGDDGTVIWETTEIRVECARRTRQVLIS